MVKHTQTILRQIADDLIWFLHLPEKYYWYSPTTLFHISNKLLV